MDVKKLRKELKRGLKENSWNDIRDSPSVTLRDAFQVVNECLSKFDAGSSSADPEIQLEKFRAACRLAAQWRVPMKLTTEETARFSVDCVNAIVEALRA